jgi:PEP-CTERM motif
MQKFMKSVAAAALVVVSGAAFADVALVSQQGVPLGDVFNAISQNGDENAPFLLGVAGAPLTTLDVTLNLNNSGSFYDFATFAVAAAGPGTVGGNPVTSTIGLTINSEYSSFAVSLYQGDLAASGNPNSSATLVATFASPTSGGSYTANLTSGNYFFYIAGTGFAYNTQPGYHVELSAAAVPEPETYALMLAGLGIVGFLASRRKSA